MRDGDKEKSTKKERIREEQRGRQGEWEAEKRKKTGRKGDIDKRERGQER